MQKIKVTNQTVRLRFAIAKEDPEHLRKYGKLFSFADAAKKFGISKQQFWYWHSANPKYQALPNKDKCHRCGFSMYEKVSEWINDGTLDHLLPPKKKEPQPAEAAK